MAEKATRELEKMQLKEKADIKYKEWLEKKRAEEAVKKKKEKVLMNSQVIWMELLNLQLTADSDSIYSNLTLNIWTSNGSVVHKQKSFQELQY